MLGKYPYKIIIAMGIILLAIFIPSFSQEDKPEKPDELTRILFVFDASQSMSGTWESDQKINIARKILIDIVDSLQQVVNVQMALRIYGHQSPVPPQDCNDTRLEVPFAPGNAPRIRQKLRFITPKGTTPIAHSLAMAASDFPDCDNCRNIVVLITDGIEACDGDPCAVSMELQKKGIVLKPFVIGIGIDPGFRETFDCVGYYYNAEEEKNFKHTLGLVITQVLNKTTAQVNLLDENGLPTETDVNMTFYNRVSGKMMYNYIHTLNQLGNPDTLELDPLVTYSLIVHTIPSVKLDSFRLTAGKHTIIPASVPQGYLVVKTGKGRAYDNLSFIVRENHKMETLNNQKAGLAEKYLTGIYDIEIPTIPRLYINDIEILQSHTTTVEVPQPGEITFTSNHTGFGSIYLLKEKKQEHVYNLNPAIRQQTILLQPGFYRIVFRPGHAKMTLYTLVKEFEIRSGENKTIELY